MAINNYGLTGTLISLSVDLPSMDVLWTLSNQSLTERISFFNTHPLFSCRGQSVSVTSLKEAKQKLRVEVLNEFEFGQLVYDLCWSKTYLPLLRTSLLKQLLSNDQSNHVDSSEQIDNYTDWWSYYDEAIGKLEKKPDSFMDAELSIDYLMTKKILSHYPSSNSEIKGFLALLALEYNSMLLARMVRSKQHHQLWDKYTIDLNDSYDDFRIDENLSFDEHLLELSLASQRQFPKVSRSSLQRYFHEQILAQLKLSTGKGNLDIDSLNYLYAVELVFDVAISLLTQTEELTTKFNYLPN